MRAVILYLSSRNRRKKPSENLPSNFRNKIQNGERKMASNDSYDEEYFQNVIQFLNVNSFPRIPRKTGNKQSHFKRQPMHL